MRTVHAILLHLLQMMDQNHAVSVVKIPPPWIYTLSDVRVYVDDFSCIDIMLHKFGSKPSLIRSQCFVPGDYDSPPNADYKFKKMSASYQIKGSDRYELQFVVREPTRVEFETMAAGSEDPTAIWVMVSKSTAGVPTVIVSAWLDKERGRP